MFCTDLKHHISLLGFAPSEDYLFTLMGVELKKSNVYTLGRLKECFDPFHEQVQIPYSDRY